MPMKGTLYSPNLKNRSLTKVDMPSKQKNQTTIIWFHVTNDDNHERTIIASNNFLMQIIGTLLFVISFYNQITF